jgi:hypothetical protein
MKKTILSRIFAALMLLTCSTGLQAAIKQTGIEQMIMDVWRVQADFHMLTVMGGSDKYRKQMEESIQRGNETLNSLRSNAESDAGNTLVSELESTWSDFIEYARANETARQGQPSRYTRLDLRSAGQSMVDRLKGADFAEEGEYSDLMSLGGDLQHIAAEYLRLAAAPGGGVAGSGDRISFEDAVPAFGERLTKLEKRYAEEDAIKRTLGQVRIRWRFIRDSLVNFSEDAVPFLIHRYSHQMTDELELAKNLATSGGAQQPMQGGAPVPGGGQGGNQGGG